MDSSPTIPMPSQSHDEAPPSGGILKVFNRVFGRHLLNIAILLILPIAFGDALGFSLGFVRDPDIWWHLADARILCTTHHFIQTEPYAFSVAGQRWINPEWLSELPFWLGYQELALRGLYLITWLVIAANIIFIYWRGYLRAKSQDAAFWAAFLGFILMIVNAGPRTIAVGYLAMSAELFILELAQQGRRRAAWFLPPLFCLWVNLHGTWFIGFALLGLYVLCGLITLNMGAIEQAAFSRSERNRWLSVFVASAIALLVNPYGWRLVWNPIDMIVNQTVNLANVAEWKPIKLSTLEGTIAFLILVLMVVANMKRSRKWTIYELAAVIFAWYAAVDHIRFAFLAAIIITPYLAMDIARSFTPPSDGKTIPAMNALIAAAALGFVAIMFPSEAKLQAKLNLAFPLQTIRSIQPSWRTFNLDYVGGMMAFESRPSLIDSRLDTFEHHGVLQNYLAAMYVDDSLEVLDYYKIDHVLVQERQPLSYLIKHMPGWQVLTRERASDDTYVLYERSSAFTPARLQGPATISAK
jgi:hypothetical protein